MVHRFVLLLILMQCSLADAATVAYRFTADLTNELDASDTRPLDVTFFVDTDATSTLTMLPQGGTRLGFGLFENSPQAIQTVRGSFGSDLIVLESSRFNDRAIIIDDEQYTSQGQVRVQDQFVLSVSDRFPRAERHIGQVFIDLRSESPPNGISGLTSLPVSPDQLVLENFSFFANASIVVREDFDSTLYSGSIDGLHVIGVPEPASALLGLTASIGLLATIRRRKSTTRIPLAGIVATLFVGLVAPSSKASAAVLVTAHQVGDDVVLSGSGAFEPSGLSYVVTAFSNGALIRANPAEIMLGGVDTAGIDVYGGTTGRFLVRPSNLGASASTLFADTGFGDRFGVSPGFTDPSESFLNVPEGYVWGNQLSASMTFSGTTLLDLGIAPGEYTWFVDGYGGPTEMLTLRVVPEPSSIVLGMLLMAALWVMRTELRTRTKSRPSVVASAERAFAASAAVFFCASA